MGLGPKPTETETLTTRDVPKGEEMQSGGSGRVGSMPNAPLSAAEKMRKVGWGHPPLP